MNKATDYFVDATKGTNGINETQQASKMLWRHTDPGTTSMFKFLEHVNAKYGLQLSSYEELQIWSVDHIGKFWGRVWNFVGVKASSQPTRVGIAVKVSSMKKLTVQSGNRRTGTHVPATSLL
jgi:hypothetical protein